MVSNQYQGCRYCAACERCDIYNRVCLTDEARDLCENALRWQVENDRAEFYEAWLEYIEDYK